MEIDTYSEHLDNELDALEVLVNEQIERCLKQYDKVSKTTPGFFSSNFELILAQAYAVRAQILTAQVQNNRE